MDLSSLTWTAWAGIIGAVTGILALLIQFFNYMHSRPRLRVEIAPECAILMDEFKTQDPDDINQCGYKPATHIVITNTGQMTAAILSVDLYASNYSFRSLIFKRLPLMYKKCEMTISYGERVIVKQSRATPFILDSGHVWMSIVNAERYRESLDKFPYVFLKIKAAHKNRVIRKRVRVTC